MRWISKGRDEKFSTYFAMGREREGWSVDDPPNQRLNERTGNGLLTSVGRSRRGSRSRCQLTFTEGEAARGDSAV
jgi:hypothetical protein